MALRTIRIFISSPGDVAEERLIARRLIGRLDAQFGGLLQFEAIAWERAPLVATATFQDQIVRPGDTDVVIVILWSRLGTALPAHIVRDDGTGYASGTEYEFEDAMRAFAADGRPHIVTYLKTAPIVPSGDLASLEEAAAQKRGLDRFLARWFRNESDGTLKAAFHGFATPADFEDLLEVHLTRLAETFVPAGMTVRASAPTWHGRSPFRGLQVFEPEHAPVFFGRTAATASVLSKLRTQGHAGRAFVLVVSMSGAGKSSLIRAGVLPLLLQPGVVGDATGWRHAVVRPADGQGRLVRLLAQALLVATRPGDADDDGAMDGAERADLNPAALVAVVRERLRRLANAQDGSASIDDGSPHQHLALVLDQLEEVFSDDRITSAERDAFFGAIDALARSGVVWILATMRSDAYARIAEAPALVALKEGEGQFDLMPPTVREIGQIIRLPALAAGLRFEVRPNTAERLDDVIRDAAARNPGALPLLQFLLEELYQRRNAEDVLTFKAYDELGGVEGALAQHAEAVVAAVGDEARAALPAALRELVTFGTDDESRALRRVAPRDAFATPAANALIDALLEARLLVSGIGGDSTPVVSLAHEALLAFWPRMKTWVEENRQLLLVHARLDSATREWERNGRTPDLLLQRGKPLSEARELVAAGIRLSATERALLDLSQRRARRFAVLRAGAIAGLVVLTVVAGIAAWRAQTESQRAQVQATTAQRTTDFMVSLFANADPEQSKGAEVTVREVLDRGVVEIDRDLGNEQGVRSNLLRAMGQAYTGLGLFSKGNDVLKKAIAESPIPSSDQDELSTRLAFADNRYQDGDLDTAEAAYRGVLTQSSAARNNAAIASASVGLAEVLSENGKLEEAENRFAKALAIEDTIHGKESIQAAKIYDGQGRLFSAQGRYVEAAKAYVQSLEIRTKLLGQDDISAALTRHNLGTLYYQTGDFARAVEAYSKVLPIYQKVFGTLHPRVAGVLNNLGRAELVQDRVATAKVHMEDSLSIMRAAYPPDHGDLILPLNSLAMIEMDEGRLDSASSHLEEALKIARARKHWMLNQVLTNEAELAVQEGHLDDAESMLVEASSVLTRQYGDQLQHAESWRLGVLGITRANLDRARGNRAQAKLELSGAFPLVAQHFGPNSFYVKRANTLSKRIDEISMH